jgi:Cu-processing system permease protein
MLAVASLSLGFLISAAVQRATTAISIALFLWLLLVFFGDLGLMGTALIMRVDISQLFFMSLLNPLQLFKIAAVLDLRQNLEVLGPAGIYATRTFGDNLLPMLLGLLLAWIVVPFAGTTVLFKRRGVL